MVATVEDGPLSEAAAGRGPPALAGLRVPEGDRLRAGPQRSRPRPASAQAPAGRHASSASAGSARWPTSSPGCARSTTRTAPQAIGWYFGNPGAFSASHTMWLAAFMTALGSRTSSPPARRTSTAASSPATCSTARRWSVPIPDLARTDLLARARRQPARLARQRADVAAHQGVAARDRRARRARGRRRPAPHRDGEGVRVAAGHARRRRVAAAVAAARAVRRRGSRTSARSRRRRRAATALRALAEPFAPEAAARAQRRPGAERAQSWRGRSPARSAPRSTAAPARASAAAARSSSFLVDAVNVVAGNLDREGGAMLGTLGVPGERLVGAARAAGSCRSATTTAARASAASPRCSAREPASLMAKEIATPGPGPAARAVRLRRQPGAVGPERRRAGGGAGAARPVRLARPLRQRDERARRLRAAATTMYERADFPLPFQTYFTTPFRQATEAVVPPAGEAREEWEVIDELMQRDGAPLAARSAALQLARRALGAGRPAARAAAADSTSSCGSPRAATASACAAAG